MSASTTWVITEAEMQENDAQFASLNPLNGFLSGEQASQYFMKSDLPPMVLARIWQLADFGKDGKLDMIEFTIAMHLVRAVLSGATLPVTLPNSLKPSVILSTTMGRQQQQQPSPHGIMQTSGLQHTPLTLAAVQANRVQADWSIPHHIKLKYCQNFNQLDKSRVGYLSGVHARNILAQSQLPNAILANIWSLSDMDKDGRLSVEEFCIALHLIEAVKAGFILPKVLPPELASHSTQSISNSPVLDPNVPPAQKNQLPKTFEDKRKDNYDRGQLELDRRRQLLREEEDRRRADFEKKERELSEKKEKEKEEAERRRQAEREAELEREKKLEETRLAEEKRILTEKEEARKEMERQRKADLNAIHIREVKAQRQTEVEVTIARQQRRKSLSFQLQALDEKSSELNNSITQARDRIVEITENIEGMKGERDVKINQIRGLEAMKQQVNVQCERLAHECLQMQAECRSREEKIRTIENLHKSDKIFTEQLETLRTKLAGAVDRAKVQQQLVVKKAEEVKQCESKLKQMLKDNVKYHQQLKSLREKMGELIFPQKLQIAPLTKQETAKESAAQQPSLVEIVGTTNGVLQQSLVSNNSLPKGSVITDATKYRALYEFNARTDDELSFQPGDIILVFENHAADPGWLAGQIKDKVGWFPMAFAEPVAPIGIITAQPPQTISSVTASPSTEPLQSIVEEPSVSSNKHILNSQSGNSRDDASSSTSVLGAAVALYQWKARNEDELSFAKGDTIEILEQLELQWKGRNKSGSIGWFPKSYVSMKSDSDCDEMKIASQNVDNKTKNSLLNKVNSPNASNAFPSYDVVSADAAESKSLGDWCVALYNFDAAESTDLSLRAGDRIFVTDMVGEWWKGTCDGRTGIFPANYVQKCPKQTLIIDQDFGCGNVIADFEATAKNQISLKVGEIVKVRSKSPSGWWQGEVSSDSGSTKVGWFPGNYIEIINQKESQAEALYDYDAQRDDELSFKSGDIIFVTERSNGEWWKGRHQRSDVEALFPANYVQLR